jgi:hypothetical protein
MFVHVSPVHYSHEYRTMFIGYICARISLNVRLTAQIRIKFEYRYRLLRKLVDMCPYPAAVGLLLDIASSGMLMLHTIAYTCISAWKMY